MLKKIYLIKFVLLFSTDICEYSEKEINAYSERQALYFLRQTYSAVRGFKVRDIKITQIGVCFPELAVTHLKIKRYVELRCYDNGTCKGKVGKAIVTCKDDGTILSAHVGNEEVTTYLDVLSSLIENYLILSISKFNNQLK